MEDVTIDTWAYIKSKDGFDIIYHNADQYVNTPEKHVIFRGEVEGTEVSFSTAWWKSNPRPSREMFSLHTGRLVEMLLRYFPGCYVKFNMVDL